MPEEKNQPLNLYLPRRLIKGNDKVFSTAMNINNVSKIIEGFSDFSNVDSMEEVRRKFEYHLKEFLVSITLILLGLSSMMISSDILNHI